MKRVISLFSFILLGMSVYSQSEDWFSEITESAGLKGTLCAKAYFGDINGDVYPDLILITGVDYFTNRQGLKVYLNELNPANGGRKFVDFTLESGVNANEDPLQDGRRTTALAMADVDNDGDLDIVTGIYFHRKESVADNGDRAELLLNDGKGRFKVSKESGFNQLERLNTQGISFLDADKDGSLDIFFGNWSEDHTNNVFQRDVLMLGDGKGHFRDFSFESGLNSQDPEPLYGSSCGDWNNDGWTDIFTAPYCRTQGSLWKNNANLTFTNVAGQVGYNAQFLPGDNGQPLCMWAAYPADFDNDGDFDFFFTLVHGGLNSGEGTSTIVENLGPDSSYRLKWRLDKINRAFPRPNHQADYEACWTDVDNDGLLDLAVGQGSYDGNPGRVYVFHQQSDHTFKDISVLLNLVRYPFRPSNRIRTCDFDLDGDDDFFLSGGTNNELFILQNNVGNRSSFVGFNLDGTDIANSSAVGAKVVLYSSKGTQTREIYAGQGNASGQGPFTVCFGLGNSSADSVRFEWPDKQNTHYSMTQPASNIIHQINKSTFRKNLPAEASLIGVFPNPTNSLMHFQVRDADRSLLKIEFWSGKGQYLRTIGEEDLSNGLDMSHLSPGIYFIKVSKGKQTQNLRILKY